MQGLGDVDVNKWARRGMQGLWDVSVYVKGGRERDAGVGGCRCV